MRYALIAVAVLPLLCGCASAPRTAGRNLEVRLATDEPKEGYRPVYATILLQTIYMSPGIEFTERDVVSASAVQTAGGALQAIGTDSATMKLPQGAGAAKAEEPVYGVTVELSRSAGRRLKALSDAEEHRGDLLVFISRGEIVLAAQVKLITGRDFLIRRVVGGFSKAEAEELAAAIRGGD